MSIEGRSISLAPTLSLPSVSITTSIRGPEAISPIFQTSPIAVRNGMSAINNPGGGHVLPSEFKWSSPISVPKTFGRLPHVNSHPAIAASLPEKTSKIFIDHAGFNTLQPEIKSKLSPQTKKTVNPGKVIFDRTTPKSGNLFESSKVPPQPTDQKVTRAEFKKSSVSFQNNTVEKPRSKHRIKTAEQSAPKPQELTLAEIKHAWETFYALLSIYPAQKAKKIVIDAVRSDKWLEQPLQTQLAPQTKKGRDGAVKTKPAAEPEAKSQIETMPALQGVVDVPKVELKKELIEQDLEKQTPILTKEQDTTIPVRDELTNATRRVIAASKVSEWFRQHSEDKIRSAELRDLLDINPLPPHLVSSIARPEGQTFDGTYSTVVQALVNEAGKTGLTAQAAYKLIQNLFQKISAVKMSDSPYMQKVPNEQVELVFKNLQVRIQQGYQILRALFVHPEFQP